MWWFAAAHANLLLLHRRFAPSSVAEACMLDAGCGTGGFLCRLHRVVPDAAAFGLDLDEGACARAAAKSGRPVCAGSVDALPFGAGAFGAIFSLDVLCHDGVDEARALAQFRRCLAAGGLLIVNLPAYRWLMSGHDRAVANVQRYTRRGVAAQLRGAGFRPLYVGYWNTLLFPAMVLSRKLLPAGEKSGGGGSDVAMPSAAVNLLGRAATAVERAAIGAGLRLPFGGSVLAVAAKTEVSDG